MSILRLVWRAVGWRRGAATAVLLVFVVTVAAAATGPFYVRAADESVLRDTLTTADPAATGLDLRARTVPTSAALATLERAQQHAGPLPYHGTRIATLRDDATLTAPGGLEDGTTLVWRDGQCRQLTVEQGRCPAAPAEVVVHRDLLRLLALHVGGTITVRYKDETGSPGTPATLRIVGVWTPRDPGSAYWTGHPEDLQAYASSFDEPDHVQALFTPAATFDLLGGGRPRPMGTVETFHPLDARTVRLVDVHRLRATTAAVSAALAARGTDVGTGLGGVLDRVARDNHRLSVAADLVLGQLAGLCLAVLVLVVSTSAGARAGEVAAARLRGMRPGATVVLALGEPAVLLAVAVPVGLAAGYGTARLLAWIRLAPGTPVDLTWSVVPPVLVVLAGAVGATLRASRQALTTSPIDLWQRTPHRTAVAGRARVRRDVAGVAGLIAALVAVQLAGDPWILLSPVLVALLGAFAGLRLLPAVGGRLVRSGRADRRLPRFLAARQVVRRPDGARVAALLVIAFALATTATTAWSISDRNARDRAATTTGAATVLAVQPTSADPDVDLLAAVRRADPTGREAMAVEEYLPFQGQPGGRILAVDARRFAAIATWRSDFAGPSAATIAARLTSPAGGTPAAVVTTSALAGTYRVQGGPADEVQIVGVDGSPLTVRTVGTARLLPRAGTGGTLLDLAATTSRPDLTSLITLPEVWLSARAPTAAIVERLGREGLEVTGTETAAGAQRLLERQGPPLAVLLSLTAAVVAVALAGATTVSAVHLSGRRRAYELAALAAVGIPGRDLRRAIRLETLALLLGALVVGAGAGAAAAALTLPAVPQFSDDLRVPPLIWTPPPGVVVVAVALAVAVSVVAAALSSRILIRAAVPERLRESQA